MKTMKEIVENLRESARGAQAAIDRAHDPRHRGYASFSDISRARYDRDYFTHLAEDIENASRAKDALIKELADLIDNDPCVQCTSLRSSCDGCEIDEKIIALVAKAKEVVR